MRRTVDLDLLRCPCCAGRMELNATIDDPAAWDGPESAVSPRAPNSPCSPSRSRRDVTDPSVRAVFLGPGQPLPFDHTHALWQGSPHDGRGVIHVVSRKKSAVTEKGPYVTYNPFGLRQNHSL